MRRGIPDKESKALIALSGGVCAFPGFTKEARKNKLSD